MVRVLFGEKGTGKTKQIIDSANEMVKASKGDVVFIDDDRSNMYNLKHEIRFINASDFKLNSSKTFMGFICGIIAEDFDISGIFIDGLTYIVGEKVSEMGTFFKDLDELSKKFNIDFTISINGKDSDLTDDIRQYVA